ncbi:SLAIN motif-containing protein-like isoform X1 [Microcaecilia unicolor]|uniref:SLAIN motif-containing protein-like isoform X1 n=1 Tax=Microcaecilia unicolor TaxID=1415580 RepID=A0A6P7YFZ0_9AMPH|nr:SLAIN motif-containing protein-like isoform X1 [Microcaecilia unicolor]
MKMVVPGNTSVAQQDHDVGRRPIEDCAVDSNLESEVAQAGTDLVEVRKLQEVMSKLQTQNQQLNTITRKSQLGENASSHISSGLENHISMLNGMEISNDSNTITEKQELKIMADLCSRLSKITDKENIDCLRAHMAVQMEYEDISSDSNHLNNPEMHSGNVDSGFFNLDAIDCSELLETFTSANTDSSLKLSDLHSSEKAENPLDETGLDEVEVLELGVCSEDEEEDSWLYVSPKKKAIAKQKLESPLKWCRQVLDHPSPETEVACRTLINRLDQASRWKTLYCSPLASTSVHNPNTETSSCSNALNSPGYLKSTNKQSLTCGSSGYLSIYSALSSQSSVDSELSTSDDSISMGYKLQDLTDVQVMARLQEESLRQDYASSSASVSRRSSSASLHSLRRGTYSDQEFDAYSLEDDEDDTSLSYRSTFRYSPSPLSSPRCQSPSAIGDHSKGTSSRIRPPRRPVKNPGPDRMKYTNNEEDIRHSMPNLARTSLRSLDSVRSSRSLESDLQVPNSRLTRIQQPVAGLTPTKLRYSPAAVQSSLTVRQPAKASTSTSTLLSSRQPVKSSGYGSPSSEVRKMQSGAGLNSSSISATTRAAMVTAPKSSPVKSRTSSGGVVSHKSKTNQPSRRSLQSSKNSVAAADDSWKEGCY